MKKYVSFTSNEVTYKQSNFEWLDDISHLKLLEFSASSFWITGRTTMSVDILYETEILVRNLYKYNKIFSSEYKPLIKFLFKGNHLFKLIKKQ